MLVHDGDQVIAEYEGTTLKRRYIYGTYIDEPLAMVTPAGTEYYHQNRLYHVMAMTNSSGQLAERYGYTPYGKRRVVSPGGATLATSAVGNQVGFTGRYHDGETGLTYFRARYMDAELGRFVSRDPIADWHRWLTDLERPRSLGRLKRTRGRGSHEELRRHLYAARPQFVDPHGWAPGDPFATPDDAAKDWGDYYNGDSIKHNIEYSSAIYYDQKTGTYSYAPASTGSSDKVDVVTNVPQGTDYAAGIHSHGAYEGSGNNEFSTDDHEAAEATGEEAYLATPNGSLLRYDNQGHEEEVSTDLPSDPNDPDRKNTNTPNGYLDKACAK